MAGNFTRARKAGNPEREIDRLDGEIALRKAVLPVPEHVVEADMTDEFNEEDDSDDRRGAQK
jgi:hypothetical protein